MPCAPAPFHDRLVAAFSDPDRPAYGQVATVDERGRPQVRTVHFRYCAARDTIAFSAHVRSPKWPQLAGQSWCAGCYFDMQSLVQWRWEGNVELLLPAAAEPTTRAILDQMWSCIRPDVRATYWLDHYGLLPEQPLPDGVDVDRRAPNIGVVMCMPTVWDLFEVDPTDYRNDRRHRFRREGEGWKGTRVHLLHSAPIGEQGE